MAKTKNPWTDHVSRVAKENPDLAFKHVLKKAKKTYKAKRGGDGEETPTTTTTTTPLTAGGRRRHHKKTAKAGKSRKAKRGGGIADTAAPF